eukprot:scaffold3767_cov114-Isochrysis_galbana.AAC.39
MGFVAATFTTPTAAPPAAATAVTRAAIAAAGLAVMLVAGSRVAALKPGVVALTAVTKDVDRGTARVEAFSTASRLGDRVACATAFCVALAVGAIAVDALVAGASRAELDAGVLAHDALGASPLHAPPAIHLESSAPGVGLEALRCPSPGCESPDSDNE